MHDDSLSVSDGALSFSVFVRPFARGTVMAFELVLRRSMGDRLYDRSLGFLSGTDAQDLMVACPSIKLFAANPVASKSGGLN